jgi:glycine betaine/proline transport system permease protein
MVKWQGVSGYVQLRKRDLFLLAAIAVILLLPVIMRRLPVEMTVFPEAWNIHLREPIDDFQRWALANQRTHPLFVLFFDPVSDAIDFGIRRLEAFLLWLPWPVIIVATFLLGQRARGLQVALLAAGGLLFMGLIGLWDESMQTLALMGVAVIISLLIGIPLGILASRYDKFEAALRPFLDEMQTMPAFVYLIPVLLFFGIARVPAVVATVIYALPPAIRLTNLGIRRVSPTTVEAARAFGSTPGQILTKVQRLYARPNLDQGPNPTGHSDDHDRREPDDHDGTRDCGHRGAHRRRGSGARGSGCAAAIEGRRGIGSGPGDRADGHYPGPHQSWLQQAGYDP